MVIVSGTGPLAIIVSCSVGEGDTMRVVILHSIGTLTGWEHCFWAGCDAEEFRRAMHAAIEEYAVSELEC